MDTVIGATKSSSQPNLVGPGLSQTSSQTSFNTGHEAHVNDAKMDYYGTKLATASSDKSVRVFSVDSRTGGYHKLAVLTGYDGPVWQLAWSHPDFGSLLATASYDGRVIIWKETSDTTEHGLISNWNSLFDKQIHGSSVNAVAWAAPEFGAMLAAGSSDGCISILSLNEQEIWDSEIINAHELGCQTVSWSFNTKRLASGGNDYKVKIWRCNEENEWTLEKILEWHKDWIFCVEWSPVAEVLVSTGRDGKILLWTKKEEPEIPSHNHSVCCDQSLHHVNINVSNSEPDDWSVQLLQSVERGSMPYVSWDPMGTFLCVSGDSKEVSIWKQDSDQQWSLVGKPRISRGALSVSFGV